MPILPRFAATCFAGSLGAGSLFAAVSCASGTGAGTAKSTADTATADQTAADALPADASPTAPTEYVATLADFDCVKNGEKVGHFYVANRLGKQAEAVAVAKGNAKGAAYPLGTILRLFPLEAMVKRGKGFEATGGWEMFKLSSNGKDLAIDQRGGSEVANSVGSCVGCHSPAKSYDFVCGTDHGCAPLDAPEVLIQALQDRDARCKP